MPQLAAVPYPKFSPSQTLNYIERPKTADVTSLLVVHVTLIQV